MISRMQTAAVAIAIGLLGACAPMAQPMRSAPAAAAPSYDLLIRGGMIYDGSGGAPYEGDVGIRGDRVIYAGPARPADATRVVDATGLAVAPGFINMLSWATESLLVDPRALSDVRQGVTLEVMGEGWSMGPYSEEMKRLAVQRQGDIKYPIEWTTLGEYLGSLERKGVAGNVDELVELTREAAVCGDMYISHMRSEGDRLLESVDELIEISRRSGAPAEIYHLKQAGRANWGKLDQVIAKVEAARASGLKITAD